MEAKKFFLRAMRICMVLAMFCVFYACNEDDPVNPPEPPTEEPVPAGDAGEVGFSITNENTGSSTEGGSSGESGSTGEGSGTGTTPEDPAVATAEESVDMTISATSSYKDPDGTTYTCEPKATITLSADLDTVYAKDIETLTKVIGNPKVTTGNTGTNPVNYTTDQIFNVGGQNVTFNLGYEVYTHTNSENQKIEMPYVKVNNANFGASTPTETKGVKSRSTETASVRLANISVVPAKKVMSRSISVTDTTTYEVTARFNLDVESKNSANDSKQTLSFEVKYIAVITETIEYDGAKLAYEVQSNTSPQNGVYVVNDPENPLEILVKQESSFMGTDGVTQTGSATTKITAVAPGDVYFANKEAIADKVQELTAITVDEQNLTSPLPYYDFEDVKFEGYNIESSSVSDTLETYHVVAKYSQVAKPVNVETATDKPAELKFAYQVEFIAKVKVELVDTEYDTKIVWTPHKDWGYTYHYEVYRSRIYSNGEVLTDTFNTGSTIIKFNAAQTDCLYANSGKPASDYGIIRTRYEPYEDGLYYSSNYSTFLPDTTGGMFFKYLPGITNDGEAYSKWEDYKHTSTGVTFAETKQDGWYKSGKEVCYTRNNLLMLNNGPRYGEPESIVEYKTFIYLDYYFLYLDGEKITFPEPENRKYTYEFEDAYNDYRGNMKIVKVKNSVDFGGKHVYAECIDTLYFKKP